MTKNLEVGLFAGLRAAKKYSGVVEAAVKRKAVHGSVLAEEWPGGGIPSVGIAAEGIDCRLCPRCAALGEGVNCPSLRRAIAGVTVEHAFVIGQLAGGIGGVVDVANIVGKVEDDFLLPCAIAKAPVHLCGALRGAEAPLLEVHPVGPFSQRM